MPAISQTISNYYLGISKQPDHKILPGQLKDIINGTPDLTEGLPKRLGSKRIGSNPITTGNENGPLAGKIFSYFRDETEGAYIGVVRSNGQVEMYSCNDGTSKNVYYTNDNEEYNASNTYHTALTGYLATSDPTDIQTLTINDTTFLTNTTKVVSNVLGSAGSVNYGTYSRDVQITVAGNTHVNTTLDYFTIASHGFLTGDPIKYHADSTAIGGLTTNTTYWVIKVSDDWFRLATTQTNAVNNTHIDFTSVAADTTHRIAPHHQITIALQDHGFKRGDRVSVTYNNIPNGITGFVDGVHTVHTIKDNDNFTLWSSDVVGTVAADPSNQTVLVIPLSNSKPDPYFAYVDLLRTENGRQYGLNLHYTDPESNDEVIRDLSLVTTDVKVATRAKIKSNTQDTSGGTGHCPGIGTQVFAVTAASSYSSDSTTVSVKNSSGTDITSGKKNLIFRITALGQQGSNPSGNFDDANISANEYTCTYNNKLDLLHGGEGWDEGDEVTVKLDQADTTYNFTIRIESIETSKVKANLKAVRPEPTPFDADTAVTVDAILGGIQGELPDNLQFSIPEGTETATYYPRVEQIGNGLYISVETLTGTNLPFTLTVQEKDLMRVIQSEISSVDELPTQCKHGVIVKVANTQKADEDDYYLRFEGENGQDGPGGWHECAKPEIPVSFNPATMPLILQRMADGHFLLKQNTWGKREVGDDETNPFPTFLDNKINKILFHRNRLAILSGENVILSRPGDLAVPNFFANTALAVSATDPIDISTSSTFPSDLFEGIETAAGLLLFSTNQQFLLAADAEVLNPDTAKLRAISNYNYDKNVPPISLGTTIGYVDNTGSSCRLMEIAQIQREVEPNIVETSKIVSGWLPKTINKLIVSPENGLIFLHEEGAASNTFYGYRYFNQGQERIQQAWFQWKFDTGVDDDKGIKFSFIVDDHLYILDDDDFLGKVPLVPPDSTNNAEYLASSYISDNDSKIYPMYLDNWTTIGGGVYDATTGLTTFTNNQTTNGVTTTFTWHSYTSGANSSVYPDGQKSEEIWLEYSNGNDWVTVGKVIPINNSAPAGLNTYTIELSSDAKDLTSATFRLHQPYNTSQETNSHMDTYGITEIRYKTSSNNTFSTLDMTNPDNHASKSDAVGLASDSNNHTGNGSTRFGGFNHTGDYLWFSSEYDGNKQDSRWLVLPSIAVKSNDITKIEVDSFVGNNSNGGEFPDQAGTSTTDVAVTSGIVSVDGTYIYHPADGTHSTDQLALIQDINKGVSFKVKGDWSGRTCFIGFGYTYSVTFPDIYYTQQTGPQTIKVDTQDYLVVQRTKIKSKGYGGITANIVTNTGDVSTGVELIQQHSLNTRRTGDYKTNKYIVEDDADFTVPIYQKNSNILSFDLTQDISTTRDNHDIGPFNLQSMTWEGTYTPKNYRRV